MLMGRCLIAIKDVTKIITRDVLIFAHETIFGITKDVTKIIIRDVLTQSHETIFDRHTR